NIINLTDIDKKDKEILALLMQNKFDNVIINNNDICFENINKYLQLVKPIDIDVKYLKRVGGSKDGGYVMFTPPPHNVFNVENKENGNKPMNGKPPIAVSLGVSNYSPWDLEMANMGYKVLQYDGSIDKGPYSHSNILFFKKYVGVVSKDNVISINDILSEFDFCEDCHNILQIDIENAEWEIFDKIDMGLLSKYFAQIIFEFHKCYPDNYELSQKKINILSKINKYYQSIHAHHPNGGLNYYCRGIFFSDLIEVSYLRKDLLPNFTNFRSYGNLKNLDFPNNPTRPDLPIRF
ncbi:hypothetical protein ACMTSI_001627, partial [Campylobacter jejuni]|nr:FkbM family methyltransferase [Campylobacter jejuni]ECR1680037.1 FkbM family methyltransferase [Campylobacter jejuni]